MLESTSVGKVGDAVTLIRVNASGAPTVGLAADLIAIDPRARGAFKVSSRAGLGLIALAADAAAHGLRVAPNLLTEGAGVLDSATGITATDQVKVEAINDRPMAEITKPAYNAHVYSGQPFKLEGRAHDPNQPGGLPCDALTWSVPSGPAAGGCSPTMTLYGDN